MLPLDKYSINRTHDLAVDLHSKKLLQKVMDIQIDMIDKQTGEVIAKKVGNYVLNFAVKNDSGFLFLHRWCESAVRGVRTSEHKEIMLQISFSEYPAPQHEVQTELDFY